MGKWHDLGFRSFGEPNPDERERILGYATGATAAPGLTSRDRHILTGQCMDAHCMEHLYSNCQALQHWHRLTAKRNTVLVQETRKPGDRRGLGYLGANTPPALDPKQGGRRSARLQAKVVLKEQNPDPRAQASDLERKRTKTKSKPASGQEDGNKQQAAEVNPTHGLQEPHSPAHAMQAELVAQDEDEDEEERPEAAVNEYNKNFASVLAEQAKDNQVAGGYPDVWNDTPVMQYLQAGTLEPGISDGENRRIKRRASAYMWRNGKLWRRVKKEEKVVPKIDDRINLIREMHETTGHFGCKRTLHLVMTGHWWQGMMQQVREVVGSCEACARVKATFNVRQEELQPLPIKGLFYRWGVDLFGPLVPSRKKTSM